MFKFLASLLLLVPFGSSLGAQTTGVPGFNDYTINGLGSSTTSCAAISIPGGGPANFQVSSVQPGMPTLLIFRLCPCQPCFTTLPDSTCPIPYTTCGVPGAVGNQSLDLNILCPGTTIGGFTGNLGVFSQTINLPPGLNFSTQAVVADFSGTSCVSSGNGWVVTQAFDVST